MRLVFLLALATAMALPAQEAAKPAEPVKPRQAGERYIQRVYQVKNVDVDQLVRLADTSPRGEGQTPVVRYSSALRAITIYGTAEEADTIVANLKALDVPRPDLAGGSKGFELTMYLLVGGTQADLAGASVPESLSDVTSQLRTVFGLTQFRLVEASIMRAAAGESQQWMGSAGTLGRYTAMLQRAQIEKGSPTSYVQLTPFQFRIESQAVNVMFRANLALKEGQKVVVGKANVDGGDKSLILVLGVKVDK